jgi:aflatoxin B1 aldehyde reductase
MKTVLGTMTFSDQVDAGAAQNMLDRFTETGNNELDTANQYNKGGTETLLGELIPASQRQSLFIASKVHPWNDQGLQPAQVTKQLNESLQRLNTNYLDLLYLHSPDLETPIEQTLSACFEAYQQGKFKTFGLSNFSAWQVAEVVEKCRQHGWMIPTVYQGMYNALTRDVEKELFACLRNYDISFYAYNPLAGGMLTGKHQAIEQLPDSGRFVKRYNYQDRYWKAEYFDVLQQLGKRSNELGVTPVEVAMSWLVNHSMMDTEHGDAIILGASKLEQLDENLLSINAAPLDQSILEILDAGWEIIKPNCFKYFRP